MAATMTGRWEDSVPVELDRATVNGKPMAVDSLPPHRSASSTGFRETTTKSLGRVGSDANMQDRVRRPSGASSVAGKKRSIKAMRVSSQQRHYSPPRAQSPTLDVSIDDPWIHRDKLAEIEIREMAEAGIYVPIKYRSNSVNRVSTDKLSRSQSRAEAEGQAEAASPSRSQEYSRDSIDEASSGHSYDEGPQRKRVSTIPDAPSQADDEEEAAFDSKIDSEHNTADEEEPTIVTAEQTVRHRSGSSGASQRPGTSRLPVSRQSPLPVRSDVVERDAPLPWSPKGSGAWDEKQYTRKPRSNSIGSQVLLDDEARQTPPGSSHARDLPERSSPTKPRKASGKQSLPKPKPSANGALAKPPASTTDNDSSRPSTSQYPDDGDPPWISNMYKPDPRLPPDQQILPTHAKKLMQEQREREGKSNGTVGQAFRVSDNSDSAPKPKPTAYSSETNNEEMDQFSTTPLQSSDPEVNDSWPLSTRASSSSAKNDSKSGTHSRRPSSGGYKMTPTIKPIPPVASPRPTSSATQTTQVQKKDLPRMPDLDEKNEPKPKKACCCVVM